ncbi:MAG TPA: chromate efflux transporter [Burkholderiaceae bacterium]|nr:chromate efflux transporter [Burkholderiaceae bacterium]
MSTERSVGARVKEVFLAFLLLGLTSFGGPVAHLGYFHNEFVTRRRWLSVEAYADLVALCQFLPGPASSQVGFALGLMRAGPLGAAAAWAAFTLPSAIVLVAFALSAPWLEGPARLAIVHGLKIAAVAVVAHAVWSMARSLCPDPTRAAIAVTSGIIVALVSGPTGQIWAILLGALAGVWLCRAAAASTVHLLPIPVSTSAGNIAALFFVLCLVGLPLLALAIPSASIVVMDAFYRAGALVFGGGHVVLPLLDSEVVQPGWVTPDAFLTGYGAAQAVPGPLFTFAAYLGAIMKPVGGIAGATLALLMIFLPGLLLLVAVLPWWNRFRTWQPAHSLIRGANASVVGILAATLYDPVWTNSVHRPADAALAAAGFLLLTVAKLPAYVVVILMAGTSLLLLPR